MLNSKDYCDYDTCVALKELGYDGSPWECSCFGAYYLNGEDIFYDRLFNSELGEDEYLKVPLYLAQKWLREEKKLYVEVTIVVSGKNYMFEIYDTETAMLKRFVEEDYSSYEEALLEGIKEAVKILKENK